MELIAIAVGSAIVYFVGIWIVTWCEKVKKEMKEDDRYDGTE